MIPKIIHLCWLSGDSYTPDIQKCLDSWKVFLQDYEIRLWDTNRFNVNSTLWTKQAFEAKKYAFAADYIRLYALYNYGGIYLDSDVLVYKSFNDLLDLPYFIGQDYTGCFEAAVIGAEPKTPWIKDVLDRYNNRPFIMCDGAYDMVPLPQVFYEILIPKYRFVRIGKLISYEWDDQTIVLFHKDFFNSRNSIGPRQKKTSYCSHCYAGTWTSKKKDLKSRFKRCLPRWILKMVYDISHRTYKKTEIHKYDPIYYQESQNCYRSIIE